jgi:tRNA pseudouridine38-40 synthase
MIVGYHGGGFYGSQAQVGRRTVQSELEAMVRRIGRDCGRLVFAGRTDRGVHAVGQVVSGNIEWEAGPESLRNALNAVGPRDLVVSDVAFVDEGFHARFDARWREYRYQIHVAPAPPILEREIVWWRRTELDAEAARAACVRLTGRHGFGAFAGLGRSRDPDRSKLARTVDRCEWSCRVIGAGEAPTGREEQRHALVVRAEGFLPQMVRNMVTAVRLVAEGTRPVEWIDELVEIGDRAALGEAAPPQGLTLMRVGYADPGDDTNEATPSGSEG